jgi:hypothetical protein
MLRNMAKRNFAELATRVLMVELGSERRSKRVAIFAGIAVVLVGGGAYVVTSALDTKAVAERERAYGALMTCLLGPPLAAKETAGERLRAVQLGALGVPKDKRTQAGTLPWPNRCAEHAHAVAENAKGTPLGTSAEALGKALTADVGGTGDHRAELEKVLKDAEAVGMKAAPAAAGSVPPPPPAASAWTSDTLKDKPRLLGSGFPLSAIKPEPATSARVAFVVDQKDVPEGPVFCSVGPTDAALRCQRLPAAVAAMVPGVRLVGTTEEGARPFYFAGDRGAGGVFPPEGGEKVTAAITHGGDARPDGSLFLLTRKEKEVHLFSKAATGPGMDRLLFAPTELDSPAAAGLFWDWVVYKGKPPVGPSHFYAKKLPAGPGELGPAVDIGTSEEASPPDEEEAHFAACRSQEAIAVRLRGTKSDSLAFFAAGRWSLPVKAPRGGTLVCRGLEATSTKLTAATEDQKHVPTIAYSKCSSTGCNTTSVGLKDVLGGNLEIAPTDATGVSAADIGGKLAVVWNAGWVGGLRMRMGAADQIKEQGDVVLADARDESSKMKLSTVIDVRLLPASTFGVLLVGTTSGVRAMKVDSSGKVVPLEVTMM